MYPEHSPWEWHSWRTLCSLCSLNTWACVTIVLAAALPSWHNPQANSSPREASVVLLMVQRVEYVMGSHVSCGSNAARVFLSILHFLLILRLFCFSLFCVGGKKWWGWWRETGSHVSKAGFELSIAKDELELLTLLPSPLQCWGRSHAPPYRVIVVLETKPGASYMLGQWNYILSLLLPFSWFRLWIC